MPSFNIIGTSTLARTLASGENGFVAPNSALVVPGPAAPVSFAGSADLVVLGAITGLDTSAIAGITINGGIQVGTAGQIVSVAGNGIGMTVINALNLTNAGLLSGTHGIAVSTTDPASDLSIRNTGTILGNESAILAGLGTGTFQLVNTGTISAGTPQVEAINVDSDNAFVENAGSIIGDVRLITGAGDFGILINTGLIQGDVLFGAGNDTFNSQGGTVTGVVQGGEGADVYSIDRFVSIVDSGIIGTDVVFTSVSLDIPIGIEELVLTGSADIRGHGNAGSNLIRGNTGDNRISGHGGNDDLFGGTGNDTLRGGAGNDRLWSDLGDDTLNGGTGSDTYLAFFPDTGLAINLAAGTATGDGTDTDTLIGIENVFGSDFADTITGGNGNNDLSGGNGNDSIAGGGGNDTITGGTGADTMAGGNGEDVFLFHHPSVSSPAAPDTITDFDVVRDTLDLSGIDANGGTVGDGAFAFGGAAFLAVGTASVRIVQDVAGNRTFVEARDTSGAEVDLRIELTGLLNLTADAFVL